MSNKYSDLLNEGDKAGLLANEYQQLSSRTLLEVPDFQISPEQVMIVWNALGLAGEAGEVANTIKKGIFHQRGLDVEKIKGEIGDVLWYVAAVCSSLGFTIEEAMLKNVGKLKARFPGGWNPERSEFKEGEAGE